MSPCVNSSVQCATRKSLPNMMIRRFLSSAAYDATLNTLKRDLKTAMMQKKAVEKNTVKSVIAAIKGAEIDGLKQDEFALFKTLSKMHKQRVQSASEYASQNRDDLAQVEQAEAGIIERYLQLLPVASSAQVQDKLRQFCLQVQSQEGEVPMKKVFGMVGEVVGEWNTSMELVRPLVPGVYKEVWGDKKK